MELERRVKTLEQEVKILKNQIQTTLKEIQEQVLIHYYPSLRSDLSSGSELTGGPPPAPNGAVQETHEPSPPEEYETEKLPSIKLVSLSDIRKQQSGMRSFFDEEESELAAETSNGEQAQNKQVELQVLAQWMVDNTAEMGIEKTRELLEMRAAGSDESAPEQKLLRFLDLFSNQAIDQTIFAEMVNSFLRLQDAADNE